jgi:hypothetical protein
MRLIILLFVTSVSPSYDTHHIANNKHYEMYDKVKKSESFIQCLPSTIASSIVGAFTGRLTKYLEQEFKVKQSKDFLLFFMIAWWIEHKVRHQIVNSLEQDFIESDIPYKKSFMHFFAWGSSWVAYLYK